MIEAIVFTVILYFCATYREGYKRQRRLLRDNVGERRANERAIKADGKGDEVVGRTADGTKQENGFALGSDTGIVESAKRPGKRNRRINTGIEELEEGV